MNNEPLKIKKRGEDGNRIISVRIREEILTELDKIAGESNYSRNELINLILDYGIKHIEIEWKLRFLEKSKLSWNMQKNHSHFFSRGCDFSLWL